MKIDYTRYYRHWHDDRPEHLATMIRHFRGKLELHLPGDRNAAILDVGCGTGFALAALDSLGYTRLEGIDADPGQIERACAQNLPASLVEDTPSWVRARPGRYDVILLLDVLEHIPRETQCEFLAALHAALAPDGRLICSVPNANSTLAARQHHMDWTHHATFTEHSLDFVLFHGGFRQISILPDDGKPPRLPWLPRWQLRWWYVRGFFRAIRRLQLIAEVGPEEGRRAALSLNLLAVAVK